MKKIGILSSSLKQRDERLYNIVHSCYVEAIEKAGAIPYIIPDIQKETTKHQLFEILDGIIFAGDMEVNPLLFDDTKFVVSKNYDTKKDEYDIWWAKKCLEHKKSVLCINRGMLMFNLLDSGENTDFDEESQKNFLGIPIQYKVKIKKNSFLYAALNEDEINVETITSSRIGKLSVNLLPIAKNASGAIEAYENIDKSVLAVQFSLELMDKSIQEKIVDYFIKECKID